MMSVCDDDVALAEKNMTAPPVLEQVTCPICLQLFSEPVSLPCGHSYCLACLQNMETGLDYHCCPECQAVYEGTETLVKNLEAHKTDDAHQAKIEMGNCVTIQEAKNESEPKQDQEIVAQCRKEFSECRSEELDEGILAAEQDAEFTGKDAPQSEAGSSCTSEERGDIQPKTEMDVPKFRLASQVTELTLKFEVAESLLRKEQEREAEVRTANTQLRERTGELLKQMMALLQSYSTEVTEMIEAELRPGEEIIRARVAQASELTGQLRHARLQAESLLTEEDEATFSADLRNLQPCIEKLMAEPLDDAEESVESKVNSDRVCSQLEKKNAELRAGLTEVQHSLRNSLNPSELTFDPDTAHPNLVLSEDLKTVTFSATKRPYPSSEQRFVNFLQVLSTQSFYGGEHCWEVELEGAPWIIGICYAGKLGRSGLPSALESSRSSWCLMWHDNMLRAFEQGYEVPLKKTKVSRRLEIRLSFKTHRLSFYDISPVSGKTHVYTFKANLVEPVNLAYRMMSGQPKARVTICT